MLATSQGPGGYAEVSGTASPPRPSGSPQAPAPAATPFTPPDTSGLGYGQHGGGSTGPGGTRGGALADQISGTAGMGGKLIGLLGEGAEAAAL